MALVSAVNELGVVLGHWSFVLCLDFGRESSIHFGDSNQIHKWSEVVSCGLSSLLRDFCAKRFQKTCFEHQNRGHAKNNDKITTHYTSIGCVVVMEPKTAGKKKFRKLWNFMGTKSSNVMASRAMAKNASRRLELSGFESRAYCPIGLKPSIGCHRLWQCDCARLPRNRIATASGTQLRAIGPDLVYSNPEQSCFSALWVQVEPRFVLDGMIWSPPSKFLWLSWRCWARTVRAPVFHVSRGWHSGLPSSAREQT